MSNLCIVGTNEYEQLVSRSNESIQKFIKTHPECVKYEDFENGSVYITLDFGKVQSKEMKGISEMCMHSLIDEVFVIGDIPATIIYSNDNLIKFKGKKNLVEEMILSSKALTTDVKQVLKDKSKIEFNIPADFISNIHDLISDFEEDESVNQNDEESDKIKSSDFGETIGLSYSERSNKKHISFDLKKLYSVNIDDYKHEGNATNGSTFITSAQNICKTFVKILLNKSKQITGEFSKVLAKNDIIIEKLSTEEIGFAYGELPEEAITEIVRKPFVIGGSDESASEIEYEKVPGQITRIRLVSVESNNGYENNYHLNEEVDSVLYTLETPITKDSASYDVYVAIESIIKQSFTDPNKYLSNWSSNDGKQISIEGSEAETGVSAVKDYVYIFNDDADIDENSEDYIGLSLLNDSGNISDYPIITDMIESGTAMKVIMPYPTGTSGYGYTSDIEYVISQAHLYS